MYHYPIDTSILGSYQRYCYNHQMFLELDEANHEVWALSVQKCEFFHADVHAGNLLVLEDWTQGTLEIWGNLRQSEATGASFGKCASFVAINGTILDFEKNVTSNVLDLKTCSSEKQRFDVTKFHPNKTSDIKWPIESLEVGLQYNQNFFQTIWKLMEPYGAILVGILMEVS